MGKADTRRINQMGYNEFDRANRQYGDFERGLTDRYNEGDTAGYGNFTGERGGVNDETWGRVSGGADTLRGAAGASRAAGNEIRDWGRNSISAKDQNRMRGGGVFDEFAGREGGINDELAGDMRAQGLSSTGSTFEGFRSELENQSRAQGGFNPGYTGQMSKIARDKARGIDESVRGTNLGIAEARNSNRRWGAEGMAQSEGAVQGQLASNRLGAYGVANQSDSIANSADASANSADLGLGELAQRGRMFGTEGLGRRNSDYNNAMLEAMGAHAGGNRAGIGQQMSYNPYSDSWSRFRDIAGMAVPIAASFMSGGTSGGGGRTAFSGAGQYLGGGSNGGVNPFTQRPNNFGYQLH